MSERFAAEAPSAVNARGQADFIKEHVLWWIGDLREKTKAVAAEGYYAPLIELAWGVLLWDVDLLAEYVSAGTQ